MKKAISLALVLIMALSLTACGDKEETGNAAQTGDKVLDWWNGDWYGWWEMTECAGYYEDVDYTRWDICGNINISTDKTGTLTLWDEDFARNNPMAEVSVTLSESDTGEYGTLTSKSGNFTDVDLASEEWVIDPASAGYENMIVIKGHYESGEDKFNYEIWLRPWGTYWDDVEEKDEPDYYTDWYLPLIKAGKSMPDSVDTDALEGSGDASGTAPSGTGIVTEEQVQKGYVWMNEVNNNIFRTTYEEMVDYFGVDGLFVKEEYSDHMELNYRYYKWISKDDDSHFLYVNFAEKEPGVFTVSAYNTSGFSSTEAIEKYLDTVKAEAAEADKASIASEGTKDFSATVTQFAHDDVQVKITAKIPKSGWSYDEDKKCLVENDDPSAFGAGAIDFEVRAKVEDFDYYKDDFENYQDIADREISGITFQGRTYKHIGYDWIEYVAQIDDGRALSIGLRKLDCAPGTAPNVILSSMTIK